jgi:hypothetical protein
MFPSHHFHLYDPVDFDSSLSGENVSIHQQLFGVSDAFRWKGIPVLLISDIRQRRDDAALSPHGQVLTPHLLSPTLPVNVSVTHTLRPVPTVAFLPPLSVHKKMISSLSSEDQEASIADRSRVEGIVQESQVNNFTVLKDAIRFLGMENVIEEDNFLTVTLCRIIKPEMAILKFRCPFYPGETSHYDGFRMRPVWGRKTTTECRLVTPCLDMTTYDNVEHASIMTHFNDVLRQSAFEPFLLPRGFCQCYDCSAELCVLHEYALTKCLDYAPSVVIDFVYQLLSRIEKILGWTMLARSARPPFNKTKK